MRQRIQILVDFIFQLISYKVDKLLATWHLDSLMLKNKNSCYVTQQIHDMFLDLFWLIIV